MSRESDLAAKMKKKGGRITTLSYGTVSAVNDSDDGVTLNVDVDDGTLAGVPMTTSCAGVSVGDRVVVERCGRLSIVTGVIAHDNGNYRALYRT